MKKIFLSILVLATNYYSDAQSDLPKNQLHGFIGCGTHGTNDLRGATIGAGYARNFAPHFFWTTGLEGTMHSGRLAALQGVQGGERMDNSIWDVQAGAEGFGGFGWAFIRTPEHELSIQLNGVLRYQYASIGYNGYYTYLSPEQGLTEYAVVFRNSHPHRTLSVGYRPQVQYQYTLCKRITIGAAMNFQYDTNGDGLSSILLMVGKRF